jgi:hypothetical protein
LTLYACDSRSGDPESDLSTDNARKLSWWKY